MRYYAIKLFDASGGLVREWASAPGGKNDPGALNVELDVPVVSFATPMGNAFVRVWGISLREIGQASDLNGKRIEVYAGMSKGLPLANPRQAGLILSGTVLQAFGNWVGTNQTLDMIVTVGGGSPDDPKNIVLNWKKGTPLATALASTLSTAFPDVKQNIAIDPKVVLAADEVGFYGSMTQFAAYLKEVSRTIIGGTYPGVDVVLKDGTFSAFDGSTPTTPKVIAFNDLIGQPTWIGPLEMQFNAIMRADLSVGDYMTLPRGQVTVTAESLSQYRNASVFQGTFVATLLRHVGNFRNPSGESWITTVNAYPSTEPA